MSTYQEIAKIAGVSVSTVSKALSGYGEISQQTKETIYLIAKQSGYFEKRNRRKAVYNSKKDLRIVVIYPENTDTEYLNEIKILNEKIEKTGKMFLCFSDCPHELIHKLTAENMADAFIVRELEIKQEFSLPVVSLSSCADMLPYYNICLNDKEKITEAVLEFFKNKGKLRVGIFDENKEYENVFKKLLRQKGMGQKYKYIYTGRSTKEVAELIKKQPSKPDALFVPELKKAEELASLLENVFIVTIGRQDKISYVECNTEQAFEEAVNIIADEILNGKQKFGRIVCEFSVNEKNTEKN